MSVLFKLIYTVLLFGITAVVVREFWFVWFDNRVYIGRFEVVTEADKDETATAAFAKRIVAQQAVIAQQLADYRTRRDALSDTTYGIDGVAPLRLPQEVLGGLDITVQEIKVSQILSTIRRGFLTPNEISGSVTQGTDSVIAMVDWPGAPKVGSGNADITRFLVPPQASIQAAAAHIACSITWARASGGDRSPLSAASALLAGLRAKASSTPSNPTASPAATGLSALSPRLQFCNFLAALTDLYAFETKASTTEGLDEKQTRDVRRHVSVLRAHYGDTAVLPDIYRLRADLLDLLPEGKRQHEELVEAQEDRLRYAMLSPDVLKLDADERRMAALAKARHALILSDAGIKDLPANWKGLLANRSEDIAAIAAATGKIVDRDGNHVGTGFVVAPGLMMTTGYVLDQIAPKGTGSPAPASANLCLGPDSHGCKDPLQIGQVIYDSRLGRLAASWLDGSNIVLLGLPDHNPAIVRPVPISDTAIEPNTVIGRYVYVVGYPAADPRMPAQFITHLLQGKGGIQLLMPGRILAFGKGAISPATSARQAAPAAAL